MERKQIIMLPPKGFEGLLTGRVVVSCSNNDEVLDLPEGTHIIELLLRASGLFGSGCLIDHGRCIWTSTEEGCTFIETPNAILQNIRGGSYVWIPTPPGADEPDVLYVWQKKRWPHIDDYRTFVESDYHRGYGYAELAGILGFNTWIQPEYIVLGDPEIMRIYKPRDYRTYVLIDRSVLEDWGKRGKPVPIKGGGWWSVFMDPVHLSRISIEYIVKTRGWSISHVLAEPERQPDHDSTAPIKCQDRLDMGDGVAHSNVMEYEAVGRSTLRRVVFQQHNNQAGSQWSVKEGPAMPSWMFSLGSWTAAAARCTQAQALQR